MVLNANKKHGCENDEFARKTIMKKILIICNTYYQVIEMIQLRLTLFKDDMVTSVISDCSNNAENVSNRLKDIKIFNDSYFVKRKAMLARKKLFLDKVKSVPMFIFGKGSVWDEMPFDNFDEMIFFNQDDDIFVLYAKLYERNQNLQVSRFEESIYSYESGRWAALKYSIAQAFRKLIGKKSLEEAYRNFYCYFPELYHGNMIPIKIPAISANGRLPDILNTIFDLHIQENAYSYRYIFFSSTGDIEGGKPIGELDLIKDVARLVGNDNLLVKVHPRDNVDRFIKEGLHVDINSNVPWEIIQLGRDFSHHIFLSVNSTSVITVTLLQENPPTVFYMYKLCNINANMSIKSSLNSLEGIIHGNFMKHRKTRILVAEKLEDILD